MIVLSCVMTDLNLSLSLTLMWPLRCGMAALTGIIVMFVCISRLCSWVVVRLRSVCLLHLCRECIRYSLIIGICGIDCRKSRLGCMTWLSLCLTSVLKGPKMLSGVITARPMLMRM